MANQIWPKLENSHGGQRSLDVNYLKERTFDSIMKCNNADDKKILLKAALNPHTDIGKVFWVKRGNTEPSLKSGTLAKLLNALNQLNAPVEVKTLTSKQQEKMVKGYSPHGSL